MAEEWEIKRLIFEEGLMLKPYWCTAGKMTIGVGRCIETNPFTSAEKKAVGDWQHGITKNAAMMLLRNDIDRCKNELSANINFYDKLDIERRYALLDMCFQLGINGLLQFKKMLKFMRLGKFKEAARECLDSKYAVQTPNRAKRIAKLIAEGIWLERWQE